MQTETTDGGRPVETTAADVLETFRERDDLAEPLTSNEVADRVGCSRRTALNRLHDLADADDVASKKVGGRARVWWVPRRREDVPMPETPDEPRADESPVTSDESASVESPGATTPETPARDHAGVTDADGDEDGLVAAVRESLADRPPKTSHGTEAVLDVFELLRERGTMKTGDLKAELYPTYSEHYGSERAMWESVSRYLEDVPGIEKGGYGEWTYAGDDTAREELEGTLPTTGGTYDPSKENL